MIKYALKFLSAAIVSGAILPAQQPSWAEHLFKMKTGRTHPAYEERVKQQRRAQEKASLDSFAKLDKDKDGVISGGEWRNSGLPALLDSDNDGSISIKEWLAAPNAGAL
jgi:hypothetical protein